eukprot:1180304-Prorocentrum_minimum.AAC.1
MLWVLTGGATYNKKKAARKAPGRCSFISDYCHHHRTRLLQQSRRRRMHPRTTRLYIIMLLRYITCMRGSHTRPTDGTTDERAARPSSYEPHQESRSGTPCPPIIN